MKKEMKEINLGMTNFDHTIDDGFAAALQAEPGEVFGRHADRDFNGEVWYADGQFHEEVWVHHVPLQTISADTLQELMAAVNAIYVRE